MSTRERAARRPSIATLICLSSRAVCSTADGSAEFLPILHEHRPRVLPCRHRPPRCKSSRRCEQARRKFHAKSGPKHIGNGRCEEAGSEAGDAAARPRRGATFHAEGRPFTRQDPTANFFCDCSVLVVVVLVVDFADERLEDVLESDDAGRATVLVHHHHHVQPPLPHQLERIHRRHGLGHIDDVLHQRRGGQRAQVGARPVDVVDQLAGEGHADHLVDGAVVDGDARVLVRLRDCEQASQRVANLDANHLHPRLHDLLDGRLVEVEHAFDHVLLVQLDRARLLRVEQHHPQLRLGDRLAVLRGGHAEQGEHQPRAARHDAAERVEQEGEPVDERQRRARDRLRVRHRERLWDQLPKEEGHQREQGRGVPDARLAPHLHRDVGGEGGAVDGADRDADEHRRQHARDVPLQLLKDPAARPARALLLLRLVARELLDLPRPEGGDGGLGARKHGRKAEEQHPQRRPPRQLAALHAPLCERRSHAAAAAARERRAASQRDACGPAADRRRGRPRHAPPPPTSRAARRSVAPARALGHQTGFEPRLLPRACDGRERPT
mmetsp:Transcript_13615/g.44333  ORF Transcript_13615/g.44333 Transcript_13615/m.44333 type:complete len:554 (+) Transcript_13615:186-1847(+)